MPETRARRRRWFLYGMILALTLMVAVLSVISFLLSHRVGALETREVARQEATSVGEIATCYATARGRPQVLLIFRGLAAKLDPNPRKALYQMIDRYEMTAPTMPQCDAKAKAAGFTRKDFPPQVRGEQSRTGAG